MDLDLSNPTIVHSICAGISFMIMSGLITVLSSLGIIVSNEMLSYIGIWLFWIGLIVTIVFSILFFMEFDIV